MERYYDEDQDALFKSAHVVNPNIKPKRDSKVSEKCRLTVKTLKRAIVSEHK